MGETKITLHPDVIDEIIKLRNKGYTPAYISRKTGASRPAINLYANEIHKDEDYLQVGVDGWNRYKRGCATCRFSEIISGTKYLAKSKNYNKNHSPSPACLYILEGRGRRPCKAENCTVYERSTGLQKHQGKKRGVKPRFTRKQNKVLGEKLLAIRKSKGLTMNGMAKYLGINKGTYPAWEKGSVFPSETNIDLICGKMGIDKEELFKEIMEVR